MLMEHLSEEVKTAIDTAIERGIEKHVNGKIRALREEVNSANTEQFKKLDELLEVFNETSSFFKVTMKIAKWVTIVGGAIGMVWIGLGRLRQ